MSDSIEDLRLKMEAAHKVSKAASEKAASDARIEKLRKEAERDEAEKAWVNALDVIRASVARFNDKWKSTGISLRVDVRADAQAEGAVDRAGISFFSVHPDVDLQKSLLVYGTLDRRVVIDIRDQNARSVMKLHDGQAAQLTADMMVEILGQFIERVYKG